MEFVQLLVGILPFLAKKYSAVGTASMLEGLEDIDIHDVPALRQRLSALFRAAQIPHLKVAFAGALRCLDGATPQQGVINLSEASHGLAKVLELM